MQSDAPFVIPNHNRDRGFFGTIRDEIEPNEAWALAMRMITEATGCPQEAVAAFLDSRYGRHFAGDVAQGLRGGCGLAPAVAQAVAGWMERRIDAEIEGEVGIPQGLPLLTGFVGLHQALLETASADYALPDRLH